MIMLTDNPLIASDQLLRDAWLINQANTPAVGSLTEAQFQQLVEWSDCCFITTDDTNDHKLSGFSLNFLEDNPYTGFNFDWFRERFHHFLYVDRIAVHEDFRRQGIGSHLYNCAFEWCQYNGLSSITCEVNDDPPNPTSHAFHQGLGFKKIESVLHPKGMTVCMYQRLIR